MQIQLMYSLMHTVPFDGPSFDHRTSLRAPAFDVPVADRPPTLEYLQYQLHRLAWQMRQIAILRRQALQLELQAMETFERAWVRVLDSTTDGSGSEAPFDTEADSAVRMPSPPDSAVRMPSPCSDFREGSGSRSRSPRR